MSATTRVNGSTVVNSSGTVIGNYKTGTIFSVSQQQAFIITVKNVSATAQDLQAEDADVVGEVDQAVEHIIREVQPLMYFVTSSSAGTISVIVDGHAVDAATLQARIRALGTVNSIDVSGTTVVLGSTLTVA
jgi:hypothetical protein